MTLNCIKYKKENLSLNLILLQREIIEIFHFILHTFRWWAVLSVTRKHCPETGSSDVVQLQMLTRLRLTKTKLRPTEKKHSTFYILFFLFVISHKKVKVMKKMRKRFVLEWNGYPVVQVLHPLFKWGNFIKTNYKFLEYNSK